MNNPQIHVVAPAKINLFLDITGVRDDGYPTLDMVMQTVTLADEVRIKDGEQGINLTCSRKELSTGPDNLVYKAAMAFCEYAGIEPSLDIHLTKSIPSQAGMGGGSSDAAAVLRGLNEFYAAYYPTSKLVDIGVSVGADVPFFLSGGTALVTGIGETVKPVSPLADCFIVIAKPNEGICTKEAYSRFDSSDKNFPHNNIDTIKKALETNNLKQTAGSMYNTFEYLHNLQSVNSILERMKEYGALGQLMSGSGSACFAIFDNKAAAKRCYRHLQQISHSVFICRPCRHGALVLI